MFGPLGGLAGLIVGSFVRGERWKEVPLNVVGSISLNPRIGVRPNGRPVVGLSTRF